jgi:glutamyl-tRNA synthetase
LLSWLQVRAAGGQFVLRIEDLDPGRSRAQHEARLLADLRWLGLDWDEGPDVGGSSGPYRQSERGDAYAHALARLSTFACTCTRKELREATLAPEGAEPLYPGTCRERPSHPERAAARRWHTPAGVVEIRDGVHGVSAQDVRAQVGEFVLRRGDGAWAYQLAVVVDDAAMRITHVLRGSDLLDSTPRQVLLQRALGLATPVYAHAPIVLGPDGAKLAKRHGAPDVSALREGGARPARVVAELARSLGFASSRPSPTLADLVAEFDVQRIPTRPSALDLAGLAG